MNKMKSKIRTYKNIKIVKIVNIFIVNYKLPKRESKYYQKKNIY